jgi:hypothetical protein
MTRKVNKTDISKPNFLYSTNDVNMDMNGDRSFVPFAAGRHDVSVSVAGGPEDPRLDESNRKQLTYRQLTQFKETMANYRQQIQEMSKASERMVAALQEIADCVPEGILSFIQLLKVISMTCTSFPIWIF